MDKDLVGAMVCTLISAIFLMIVDAGMLRFSPLIDRLFGAFYMACGSAVNGCGIGYLIEGHLARGAATATGGTCLFLAGWKLYHDGKPPRRKRRRVRSALLRLRRRPTPIPVYTFQ